MLTIYGTGASGIAYATVVTAIFAIRYLDLLRYSFKLTWLALAITIAAEIAGKAILNNGFATQLRPRQYYTISKETLEAVIGDVNELINFFVIEAQRILFVENLAASVAVSIPDLFFLGSRTSRSCDFRPLLTVFRLPSVLSSLTILSRSSPPGALH